MVVVEMIFLLLYSSQHLKNDQEHHVDVEMFLRFQLADENFESDHSVARKSHIYRHYFSSFKVIK